jgi:hypothetical protein
VKEETAHHKYPPPAHHKYPPPTAHKFSLSPFLLLPQTMGRSSCFDNDECGRRLLWRQRRIQVATTPCRDSGCGGPSSGLPPRHGGLNDVCIDYSGHGSLTDLSLLSSSGRELAEALYNGESEPLEPGSWLVARDQLCSRAGWSSEQPQIL